MGDMGDIPPWGKMLDPGCELMTTLVILRSRTNSVLEVPLPQELHFLYHVGDIQSSLQWAASEFGSCWSPVEFHVYKKA